MLTIFCKLSGARVILACRDTAKGREAAADIQNDPSSTGKVKVMQLNLASLKSIRQFVNEFNKGVLDICLITFSVLID